MKENQPNDNLNLSETFLVGDSPSVINNPNYVPNDTSLNFNDELNNISNSHINVDNTLIETLLAKNINKDVMNLENGNAIVHHPVISRDENVPNNISTSGFFGEE